MCANTCSEYALSESVIISNSAPCSNASNYNATQIRADFTNCALPADSLKNRNFVQGSINEPINCGFGGSTLGMCTYCSGNVGDTRTSSQHPFVVPMLKFQQISVQYLCQLQLSSSSTSSVVTSTSVLSTNGQTATTPSSSRSGASLTGESTSGGLSRTTIAVIILGSVVALVLLTLLALILIFCVRKRRNREKDSALLAVHEKRAALGDSDLSSGNRTPSPPPQGPTSDFTVLPGGRIARKSPMGVFSEVTNRPKQLSQKPPLKRLARVSTPPEPGLALEYTLLPGG